MSRMSRQKRDALTHVKTNRARFEAILQLLSYKRDRFGHYHTRAIRVRIRKITCRVDRSVVEYDELAHKRTRWKLVDVVWYCMLDAEELREKMYRLATAQGVV